MIRVNGGIYKGKRLKLVPGFAVRPIPDKLKESLFSIIRDEVPGSFFLDGFAGTGSVGIEALSRGADRVVFIDNYNPAVKAIKTNIARCGAEEKSLVVRSEFNRGVIRLAKEGAKFDLIFLDPPYKLLEERNPLRVIIKREILAEGGKIILRHFYKTELKKTYFSLQRKVTKGDDTLSFYV
jgi:16S rRNA (guanine966-N2)-methyltransferase